MTRKRILPVMISRSALAAAALSLVPVASGAAPKTSAPAKAAAAPKVSATAYGGVLIGDPKARTRLVEYISFTCPHCATFARESAGPIKTEFVNRGTTAIEIRPYVRNALDFSASLLAACGGPTKFIGNYDALLAAQQQWTAKANAVPVARQKAWVANGAIVGAKLIATDSGMAALMKARGFSAAQLNACLTNPKTQAALQSGFTQANDVDHIPSTPSFTIDGKLIADVYDWAALRTELVKATARKR